MVPKFQIKIQSNPLNCPLFQRINNKSKQFLRKKRIRSHWVKKVQTTWNRKKISMRAVGPTTNTQTRSLQLMRISRYQQSHQTNSVYMKEVWALCIKWKERRLDPLSTLISCFNNHYLIKKVIFSHSIKLYAPIRARVSKSMEFYVRKGRDRICIQKDRKCWKPAQWSKDKFKAVNKRSTLAVTKSTQEPTAWRPTSVHRKRIYRKWSHRQLRTWFTCRQRRLSMILISYGRRGKTPWMRIFSIKRWLNPWKVKTVMQVKTLHYS